MKIFTLLLLSILLNSCGNGEQKRLSDKLHKDIEILNEELSQKTIIIKQLKSTKPLSKELDIYKEKLTQSESNQIELKRQINTQKANIETINVENTTLKQTIEEQSLKLQESKALIASLNQSIVDLDTQISNYQKENITLKSKIEEVQKPKIIKKSTTTDDGFSQVVRGKRAYSKIKDKPNIIKDTLRGLLWQREDDGTRKTHKEAIEYCKTLTLDGIKEWRLPTIEELYYLADRTKKGIKIDENYFKNTKSNWYWTSTSYQDSSSSSFWVVHFASGFDGWTSASGSFSVRCVRQ